MNFWYECCIVTRQWDPELTVSYGCYMLQQLTSVKIRTMHSNYCNVATWMSSDYNIPVWALRVKAVLMSNFFPDSLGELWVRPPNDLHTLFLTLTLLWPFFCPHISLPYFTVEAQKSHWWRHIADSPMSFLHWWYFQYHSLDLFY